MKKWLCIFFLASASEIISQDNFFVTPQQSLIFLNPSFAGSNGGIRVQSSYQNVDQNLSNRYWTVANSFDFYLKKLKAGIAFSHTYSDASRGLIKSNYYSLTYAQHLSFKNNNLKIIPSLQMIYAEQSLDPSSLTFDYLYRGYYKISAFQTYYPPRKYAWQPIPSNTRRYADFSAALLFSYKKFYFGFSVFHITQPESGFQGSQPLMTRTSGYASYNLKLNEKTLINFSSRIDNQGNFSIFQMGADAVFFKHLVLGMSSINTWFNLNPFSSEGIYLNNTIGYRNNFWSCSISRISDFGFRNTNPYYNFGTQLNLSYTLRNPEQRRSLCNFEAW